MGGKAGNFLNDSMTVQREYNYAEFKPDRTHPMVQIKIYRILRYRDPLSGKYKRSPRWDTPKLCDIEIERCWKCIKDGISRLEAVLNSTPLQGI